jgi:ABC-2 type transport system permease protein
MKVLSELATSRDLMVNLTLRELRGKYKRSVLGWSWSLLNPLATMLIFSVVFRLFLKVPVPRGDPSGMKFFAFFLLCGLLPWTFLANGMGGGMGALVANANLIKKVYFRREVLVAANVASWLVSFLIELAVLSVALIIFGNFVLPWLVPVAVIVVIQTTFVLGLALMLSVLNVYFRDTQHLLGILLQLWFYATPIVYPITLVPEHHEVLGWDVPVRAIYELNPMVRFVEVYRDCLYHLRLPSLGVVGALLGLSVVTLAAGLAIFRRLEPRLAEEL